MHKITIQPKKQMFSSETDLPKLKKGMKIVVNKYIGTTSACIFYVQCIEEAGTTESSTNRGQYRGMLQILPKTDNNKHYY